jgi:hypothetical protein
VLARLGRLVVELADRVPDALHGQRTECVRHSTAVATSCPFHTRIGAAGFRISITNQYSLKGTSTLLFSYSPPVVSVAGRRTIPARPLTVACAAQISSISPTVVGTPGGTQITLSGQK